MVCAAGLLLSLVIDVVLGHASGISCSTRVNFHLNQLLDWDFDLHVLDDLVLLATSLRLDPLPRKTAHKEVDQYKAQALEIVPSRLLNTDVCVEARIPGSSREGLTVLIRDMLATAAVSIALRQTEINDVDVVLSTAYAHQKVVWLDVAVKIEARVDVFDALDHLVRQHQHRFQRELTVALAEKLLQTGA